VLDADFNNIAVDDQLWELDMFRSEKDWAFHSDIRKGIDAIHLNARCREEVDILIVEFENYIDWAVAHLDGIADMLRSGVVPADSRVGRDLWILGMKTADSLLVASGIGDVDLKWTKSDEFSEKLQCNSSPPGS